MKLGDMKSLCLGVHVLKVCVMNFFSWKIVTGRLKVGSL